MQWGLCGIWAWEDNLLAALVRCWVESVANKQKVVQLRKQHALFSQTLPAIPYWSFDIPLKRKRKKTMDTARFERTSLAEQSLVCYRLEGG
jgi:hypothetical protein